MTRAGGGGFGQDTGVTPLLFTRSPMGFLMTTESQDLGLTSPKDKISLISRLFLLEMIFESLASRMCLLRKLVTVLKIPKSPSKVRDLRRFSPDDD